MDAGEKVVDAIVRELPIKEAYRDALSPAAKQVGHLAEDIVKVVRLALLPVTAAGFFYDRAETFVKKAVSRVAASKRVSPAPQILGPVLEGIRYEPEGAPIDQMFSELLSASMDADRLRDAHPSFPMVIKQMSSDEAKILNSMWASSNHPKFVQTFELREDGLAMTSAERNDLPVTGLTFPENLSMYTDRLQRLGLIQLHAEKRMEPIVVDGTQTGGRNFFVFKFTEVGEAFMRACHPTQNANPSV